MLLLHDPEVQPVAYIVHVCSKTGLETPSNAMGDYLSL